MDRMSPLENCARLRFPCRQISAPGLTRSIIVVFDATMHEGELAGSVPTVLARNVRHLEPEAATFSAMLDGWGLQQRSRFLKASTIGTRRDMVRRFARFTNEYP